MLKPNRREWMEGVLATMAVGAVPSVSAVPLSPQPQGTTRPDSERIKICLFWGDDPGLAKLSKQIGVTHTIVGTSDALSRIPRSQYLETVAKIKARYEAAGLTIAGIESDPVPTEKIKLGLPGRDEEIENYIAAIEALGEVGIRMVCYNFMAGNGWYRTNKKLPGRGGCVRMSFDTQDARKEGLTQWGRISEEQMWHNIEYFLKAVIPVAEKAGVQMALHPDDPPVPELRGIARIIISGASYRRVMNIVPSPVNGVTFDWSVMYLTGENIKALAEEWSREKKVFFIHARNLRGTANHFEETFQDDGAVDLGEMLQTFHDNGFRGPLRPDHDPILEGDAYFHPSPAHPWDSEGGVMGKVLGVGYIKGVMASRHIPYI